MIKFLKGLARLASSHIDLAVDLVVKAIFEDPSSIYFFPDISTRKEKLQHLWKFFLGQILSNGKLYAISSNIEGLAGWIFHNPAEDSMPKTLQDDIMSLTFQMGFDNVMKISCHIMLCGQLHEQHANFPHWCLSPVAVTPELQGKGYASRLLDPMLSRIDNEQKPCYLQIENEKNVPIYEHFGFELIEKANLPNTDIYIWCMLRESEKTEII